MTRYIYSCKNKACKQVRSIDYPESRQSYRGYGRYAFVAFRINEYGREVEAGYESLCSCGRHATGVRVKGFVTEHVCDARCTSAKGPNCECSCGGKNHGQAYAA